MGKKISKIMISVIIACLLLSACGSYKYGPLSGDYTSETTVISNGGFVAEYGVYTYFINGMGYNYSDNTFGDVIKASLMRVLTTELYKEDADYQIVVPKLMVTGAFKQGFYISGDYVYYATPTAAKNKKGVVEYSYLDITRTKLDGTDTSKTPFFRLETNTTDFRFMEIDGTIYVVYVIDNVIYSYNIPKDELSTLVDDASAVILPSTLGETTIYYTKDVKFEDTENKLSYNEVYSVKADGSENKLIISGLGKDRENSLTTIDINNKIITLIKEANGYLYFTAKENYNESSEYGYAINLSTIQNDTDVNTDSDEIENFFKSVKINNLTYFKDTTIFIEDNIMLYFNDSNIVRYSYSYNATTGECTGTELPIVKKATSPTLLYILEDDILEDDILEDDYLYYYQAGTNGNNLFRIKYNGNRNNYNPNYFYDQEENLVEYFASEQIGEIDYASAWFAPEIIGNNVFFANAADLGYNYVYIYNIINKDIEDYEAVLIGYRTESDETSYQEALKALEEEAAA